MKEGWTYKKLGEVCYKITDGSHNPPKGIEHSDNVMLSSQNVQNGFLDMSAVRYLSDADFEIENKRTNASKGDVLLTIVGTIGRTCVLKGNEGNITFQRSVAILKPKEEIMSRYLMFFLMSCNSKLNSTAQGAAQKGIYLKQLGNITLHYPSIDEQQRIVERLDSAFENIDKLKANAEKQLSEARILFQKSLAKAMESKEGWEEKKLRDISLIKGGKRVPQGYKFETEKTDYPYIRVADFTDEGTIDLSDIHYINNSVFQKIKNYIISDKDIYISIAGTIGKSGIIPSCLNGANLTENACKLVLKDGLDQRYVYWFTKSDKFKDQISLATRQTSQPKLALTRLAEVLISLPPLTVQQRIVERLDSLSENVRKYEKIQRQIISECDALKQALLRKVFE